MKLTLAVTSLTLVMMPAFTHGQIRNSANKPAMPTKAEIQNMVQAIIGSKPKVQAYCQLSKLYDQLTDANARREKKTLEILQANAEELLKKVGPDYEKLLDAHDQVDPDSSVGRQITVAFDKLDKQCK